MGTLVFWAKEDDKEAVEEWQRRWRTRAMPLTIDLENDSPANVVSVGASDVSVEASSQLVAALRRIIIGDGTSGEIVDPITLTPTKEGVMVRGADGTVAGIIDLATGLVYASDMRVTSDHYALPLRFPNRWDFYVR
jgi:hypothetical protein